MVCVDVANSGPNHRSRSVRYRHAPCRAPSNGAICCKRDNRAGGENCREEEAYSPSSLGCGCIPYLSCASTAGTSTGLYVPVSDLDRVSNFRQGTLCTCYDVVRHSRGGFVSLESSQIGSRFEILYIERRQQAAFELLALRLLTPFCKISYWSPRPGSGRMSTLPGGFSSTASLTSQEGQHDQVAKVSSGPGQGEL